MKVSVAALVRVKLAASAPVMLKLPSVVVPDAAPPEGVTAMVPLPVEPMVVTPVKLTGPPVPALAPAVGA